MKKILLTFFTLFIVNAASVFGVGSATLANDTLLGACVKEYPLNHKELYLSALSAIGNNKFEVLEMQSKSGLILFQAGRTEYVATVYVTKSGSSEIKILPANSNFTGGVEVQKAIFSTLDNMAGR